MGSFEEAEVCELVGSYILKNTCQRTPEDMVAPSLSHESKPKQEERHLSCKLFNELPKDMKTEKPIFRFKGNLKSLYAGCFLSTLLLVSSFYLS